MYVQTHTHLDSYDAAVIYSGISLPGNTVWLEFILDCIFNTFWLTATATSLEHKKKYLKRYSTVLYFVSIYFSMLFISPNWFGRNIWRGSFQKWISNVNSKFVDCVLEKSCSYIFTKSFSPKHDFCTWHWHWKPLFWNSAYCVLEKSSSYVQVHTSHKAHLCIYIYIFMYVLHTRNEVS